MSEQMQDDKFKKSIFILSISNLLVGIGVLIMAITLLVTQTGIFSKSRPVKDLKSGQGAVFEGKISEKYASKMTFEEAKKTGKPVAILFYADWCDYCKKFAPLQFKLSNDPELLKKYSFLWINADDKQKNAAILKDFNVKGFPTLYLVDLKKNKKQQVMNKLMFTRTAEEDIKKIYRSF